MERSISFGSVMRTLILMAAPHLGQMKGSISKVHFMSDFAEASSGHRKGAGVYENLLVQISNLGMKRPFSSRLLTSIYKSSTLHNGTLLELDFRDFFRATEGGNNLIWFIIALAISAASG